MASAGSSLSTQARANPSCCNARRGYVGHEAKRCRYVVELEMGMQQNYAAIDAGAPRPFPHGDARADERIARPHLRAGRRAGIDIPGQPRLQLRLDLLGGLERSDHIAADDLDVMGETRHAEH